MRVVGATISIVSICACTATVTQPPNGGDDDAGGTSGPYFATQMFFNRDVSGVAPAANSDAIIASLRAAGVYPFPVRALGGRPMCKCGVAAA